MPDTPGDDDAWRDELRDVTPLQAKVRAAQNKLPDKEALRALRDDVRARQESLRYSYEPPMVDARPVATLDDNSLRRIRQGKMAIERTLDLHDMTLAHAQDAFYRFICEAFRDNIRVVLVITGKGRIDADNTIRQSLPRWCESPQGTAMIIGIHPAHLRHGGSGAYYVRIRRDRR